MTHEEFIEQVRRDEAEQRKNNAIWLVCIIVGMFAVAILLAELGVPSSAFRLPWAW